MSEEKKEGKKYELTDISIDFCGVKLFRIRALKSFGDVKEGDLGGYVEKEENLSQDGDCWIYEKANVLKKAIIMGGTFRGGTFWGGDFRGGTFRGGEFWGGDFLGGDFMGGTFRGVKCYVMFKNWWSSGRIIIWARSINKWSAGCFFGTGEELVAKAYADSEKKGREYKRVVDYVNSILEDERKDEEESAKVDEDAQAGAEPDAITDLPPHTECGA